MMTILTKRVNRMEIKCLVTGDWACNTYIVEDGKSCVIVDAGQTLEKVKSVVTLPVKAILVTHAHFDHIWYLRQYQEYWQCPVYMARVGVDKLDNPITNLSRQFCEQDLYCELDKTRVFVAEGDIDCFGLPIIAVSIPGHSNCSVAYIIDQQCFSGDLVFADGIGRTDFADGNIVSLYRSVKKLMAEDIIDFYVGHGPVFSKDEYQKVLNIRS